MSKNRMRKISCNIVLSGCGKTTKRAFWIKIFGLLRKFAYITAYGRSTYIIVIGLKMKFYAGKCPKIFRHVQFGRKMLLYPKISFTSNGSIYVLIRRREAVKHRISCLRYTVENRYQRRRANWRFRMPRLTEFFAVLPAVFIAANVRGDKSPVIPRAAHFAPPAVFKLKFGSASSYEKAGRLL